MTSSIEIDLARPIPLFPLPTCVLLPHVTVPLHIFEQRYRAMTADVLEHDSVLAMATFHGTQWRTDYEGAPPLREHVCIGRIVRHSKLPDGRYHILLQGLGRASIVEEIPHQPYRVALLDLNEDAQHMEIDLLDERERIVSLLEDPLLNSLAAIKAVHSWLDEELSTSAIVDLTTMTFCRQSEDIYAMLANDDALSRADRLARLLEQTRHTLEVASRFTGPVAEDGNCLN